MWVGFALLEFKLFRPPENLSEDSHANKSEGELPKMTILQKWRFVTRSSAVKLPHTLLLRLPCQPDRPLLLLVEGSIGDAVRELQRSQRRGLANNELEERLSGKPISYRLNSLSFRCIAATCGASHEAALQF